MNDLLLNDLANKMIKDTDFKIISIKGSVSILHDISVNSWYFAILDKKLKPIYLCENDFDLIIETFNYYLFHGHILWENLE